MQYNPKPFPHYSQIIPIAALWAICLADGIAQNLTLPVYRLLIDPNHLQRLYENEWSNITYSALTVVEGDTFACEVRFRGATGRNEPKKSWRINFDCRGPLEWKVTNLNSEYRDRSLSRNYLVMALARYAGLSTPDARFVSLIVNDEYYGVYVEIEEIDEDFYRRRGLGDGAIFKTQNHSARFVPPSRPNMLQVCYQGQKFSPSDYDTLLSRMSVLRWTDERLDRDLLESFFDVEEVLSYFALQISVSNFDGFIKNILIHQLPDGRYIFSPWDCDASLGNNWLGNYWHGFSRLMQFTLLEHHAVLQHLIQYDDYRNFLLNSIHTLATDGFERLSETTFEIVDQISHYVELDTLRRGNMADFRFESSRIRTFFAERLEVLRDFNGFNRPQVRWWEVRPSILSSPHQPVIADIAVEADIDSASLVITDVVGTNRFYQLNDAGEAGDYEAEDGIWGGGNSF